MNTIEKINFAEISHELGEELAIDYQQIINEISMDCHVRIGSLTLTVAQLKNLRQGQVLQLQQEINEPVEVLFKDYVIARGELLNCEDNFAVLITEVSPCEQ